jgi:hypothetical protein
VEVVPGEVLFGRRVDVDELGITVRVTATLGLRVALRLKSSARRRPATVGAHTL